MDVVGSPAGRNESILLKFLLLTLPCNFGLSFYCSVESYVPFVNL